MSATVLVLAGLAVGTYALKAAGPLLLGGRPLPAWLEEVARSVPAALLAAMVVVSTVTEGRELVLDARAAGVAAAGVALWRRAPMALAVLVAVVTTAAVRAAS